MRILAAILALACLFASEPVHAAPAYCSADISDAPGLLRSPDNLRSGQVITLGFAPYLLGLDDALWNLGSDKRRHFILPQDPIRPLQVAVNSLERTVYAATKTGLYAIDGTGTATLIPAQPADLTKPLAVAYIERLELIYILAQDGLYSYSKARGFQFILKTGEITAASRGVYTNAFIVDLPSLNHVLLRVELTLATLNDANVLSKLPEAPLENESRLDIYDFPSAGGAVVVFPNHAIYGLGQDSKQSPPKLRLLDERRPPRSSYYSTGDAVYVHGFDFKTHDEVYYKVTPSTMSRTDTPVQRTLQPGAVHPVTGERIVSNGNQLGVQQGESFRPIEGTELLRGSALYATTQGVLAKSPAGYYLITRESGGCPSTSQLQESRNVCALPITRDATPSPLLVTNIGPGANGSIVTLTPLGFYRIDKGSRSAVSLGLNRIGEQEAIVAELPWLSTFLVERDRVIYIKSDHKPLKMGTRNLDRSDVALIDEKREIILFATNNTYAVLNRDGLQMLRLPGGFRSFMGDVTESGDGGLAQSGDGEILVIGARDISCGNCGENGPTPSAVLRLTPEIGLEEVQLPGAGDRVEIYGVFALSGRRGILIETSAGPYLYKDRTARKTGERRRFRIDRIVDVPTAGATFAVSWKDLHSLDPETFGDRGLIFTSRDYQGIGRFARDFNASSMLFGSAEGLKRVTADGAVTNVVPDGNVSSGSTKFVYRPAEWTSALFSAPIGVRVLEKDGSLSLIKGLPQLAGGEDPHFIIANDRVFAWSGFSLVEIIGGPEAAELCAKSVAQPDESMYVLVRKLASKEEQRFKFDFAAATPGTRVQCVKRATTWECDKLP